METIHRAVIHKSLELGGHLRKALEGARRWRQSVQVGRHKRKSRWKEWHAHLQLRWEINSGSVEQGQRGWGFIPRATEPLEGFHRQRLTEIGLCER